MSYTKFYSSILLPQARNWNFFIKISRVCIVCVHIFFGDRNAHTHMHAWVYIQKTHTWISNYTHRRTQLYNQMFVESFETFSCWPVQYDLLVPCSQDLLTSPVSPHHHQCHLHVQKTFFSRSVIPLFNTVTCITIPNGPICHKHLIKRETLIRHMDTVSKINVSRKLI